MKINIILALASCVFVIVECRPQDYEKAKIVHNDFTLDNNGNFQFRVDTTDDFHHTATGYINKDGSKDEFQVVKGWYSYRTQDGGMYIVNYIADNNGFQPKVIHVPFWNRSIGYASPSCLASLCGTGLG